MFAKSLKMFSEEDGRGGTASSILSSFFILAVTWITWRIWTFALKPALSPKDPKVYPYWIPILGHAPAFMRDSQRLFTQAREHFGNTRQPFALTVMGQRIYIVNDPNDLPTLYKSTSTLTFDGFIRDFFHKEGVKPQAVKTMFTKKANRQNKVLAHAGEDLFKQQLQPGPHLPSLFGSIAAKISDCIQWDSLSSSSVISATNNTKTVSLLGLCLEILVKPVSIGVFGTVVYDIEPRLSDIFRKFDENSGKMNYELPRFAAPDVYDAKDEIRAVMLKYIKLPAEQRRDASWLIHSLEDLLRGGGIDDEDIASFFFGPFWTNWSYG